MDQKEKKKEDNLADVKIGVKRGRDDKNEVQPNKRQRKVGRLLQLNSC